MLGKTILYSYFDGGNIRSKREYDYTTVAEPSDWDVKISYEYDTAWKDKLIKYGDETITYDAIGNPLSYLGRTFTWQKGRQLSSTVYDGNTITYKYNWDGLRTKKVLNGKTTTYYYSGSMLMGQSNSDDKLLFPLCRNLPVLINSPAFV